MPVENGDVSGAWCDPRSRDGFRENGRTEDGSFPVRLFGKKKRAPGLRVRRLRSFFCLSWDSFELERERQQGARGLYDRRAAGAAQDQPDRSALPLFGVAITCGHAPQGEHSREAGSEAIASARTFRPLRFDCT